MNQSTEQSFLNDVSLHTMTVIRDHGVHRHLRFGKPGSGDMYFDIVTYPHLLCWSWFIERQDAAGPRMGLHHDGGIHFSLHNSGGYIVVGRWWLHWQNYRIPALTVPEGRP